MQTTVEKELLEKEVHGQVKGNLLCQTTLLSKSPNNFPIDAYNKLELSKWKGTKANN